MFSQLPTLSLLLSLINTISASSNRVLQSSFTYYPACTPDDLPACGPSAKTVHDGTAFAAANSLTYTGSGSAMSNGMGSACGQCWLLTPQSDPYPQNANKWGTSIVVKINNHCPDPGYCDTTPTSNGNSKYHVPVHFDICNTTGAAEQFFGSTANFGVLLGLAQLQDDCSGLHNGPFGSGMPALQGPGVPGAGYTGDGGTGSSGGDTGGGSSAAGGGAAAASASASAPASSGPAPHVGISAGEKSKALPAGGNGGGSGGNGGNYGAGAPGQQVVDDTCEL